MDGENRIFQEKPNLNNIYQQIQQYRKILEGKLQHKEVNSKKTQELNNSTPVKIINIYSLYIQITAPTSHSLALETHPPITSSPSQSREGAPSVPFHTAISSPSTFFFFSEIQPGSWGWARMTQRQVSESEPVVWLLGDTQCIRVTSNLCMLLVGHC